nr:hypothetical protein CFP56_22385 [Quercus suber]
MGLRLAGWKCVQDEAPGAESRASTGGTDGACWAARCGAGELEWLSTRLRRCSSERRSVQTDRTDRLDASWQVAWLVNGCPVAAKSAVPRGNGGEACRRAVPDCKACHLRQAPNHRARTQDLASKQDDIESVEGSVSSCCPALPFVQQHRQGKVRSCIAVARQRIIGRERGTLPARAGRQDSLRVAPFGSTSGTRSRDCLVEDQSSRSSWQQHPVQQRWSCPERLSSVDASVQIAQESQQLHHHEIALAVQHELVFEAGYDQSPVLDEANAQLQEKLHSSA